ncbi:hypothetical protein AB9C52_25550, partial [Burkholderia cenocepacia]|uniref:hypothetical protein n=1 Tax=Burkholderia cenocepacia TaxID=95486 RepID=UPI00350EC97D
PYRATAGPNADPRLEASGDLRFNYGEERCRLLGIESAGKRVVDATQSDTLRFRFERTNVKEAADHVGVHDRREYVE